MDGVSPKPAQIRTPLPDPGWAELHRDPRNPNRGTDRGRALVRSSLEQVGPGRSIVVDGKGVVVAGNTTMEAAIEKGLRPRIVDLAPDELLVARRPDWDASAEGPDNPARKYRYLDNRSGELGLDWDAEVLAADMADGVDLEAMGFDAAALAGMGLGSVPDSAVPPTDFKDPEDDMGIEYRCPECGYEWSGKPK